LENEIKSAFGKALLEVRTKKKISQQKLADYADMDRAHISALESGQYAPSLLTFYKLCLALEIKPS